MDRFFTKFIVLFSLCGLRTSSGAAFVMRQYSSSSLSSLAVAQNAQSEAREMFVKPRELRTSKARILSRGEQTLLASQKYGEIGGNQNLPQDPMELLKERLLARLQGRILVETTIVFKSYVLDPELAREVVVVGSWAQWVLLHAMERDGPDAWKVTLNLPPGEHQFKFIVDGQWARSVVYDSVDDSVGSDGNNLLQVWEPADDAGLDALETLEQCLRRAGMAGSSVLGSFVEAWMWRNCPV